MQQTETPTTDIPDDFILIEVGTGTPFGLSHYELAYTCGLRAHLNHEAFVRSPFLIGNYYQNVGSILHGLLKQHHGVGFFNLDQIAYDKHVDDRERSSAERIYRKYRLENPPTEFGMVLRAEAGYGWGKRATKDLRKRVSAAVGAGPLPYTFQPDLEVYLDTAAVKRVESKRKVKLAGPGVYLVDHKTYADWMSCDDRYLWGLQGTAYQLAWEAVYDKRPKGLIFNLLDRNDGVKTLFHSYPTPPRIRRLHDWFKLVRVHLEAHGRQFKNPNACFQADVCPHFTRGLCPGF